VNIDLSKLTQGLTFGAKYSIDYATSYYTSYTDSYATFVPTWQNFNGKDEIVDITQEGKDEHTGVQNVENSSSRQTQNFSAQFDYTRCWNDVNNFHAMLIAAGWQRSTSGQYHKTSSANLGLGIDYNYDHRYYVDFGSSLVHSAKLAPGHRNGISVSGTIGWNLANEEWFKDNENVNNFMISLSASNLKQDMDIENYYMYTANYTNGGWYSWAPNGQAAAYPQRGSNDDLTFITRKEYSATVRGDFFNRALGINASVFMYDKSGMLINNSTKFPSFFSTYYPESSFVPWLNNDANRTKGFDFGVTGRKKFGDFELELGVNGTYYKTKATKRDEVHEDAYQYAEGKDVDAIWGYRCLGFFKSDSEAASVDQSALGSASLKAGDLMYEDVNGDGVVNSQDRVFLGRGGWYGDPFTLGVNLTAKYKGFTLFVHCTGGFGANALKSGSYYRPSGENKYSSEVLGRWTPETAATATLPRLLSDAANNNNVDSDFWMYSRDRFEIAKVQLTYDFASSLFAGKIVKGIQLFLSGDDLLMISKNKKIMETNVGGAPQSRFYNIGATVSF
ncbi:MAG: SusC/RagA family TonB-linked outer membrane protein, partial [Muribaculaceae bacterium]|nr:SusC/RagA family TonB-linked outer membrane protein [Muribaculaceae bacterium]